MCGCLHDYTLKTSDLKKVEDADVIIMNGLGIESFTDKILQTNENVQVIEASQNLILEDEMANAHVWMNIDYYISQVETVAEALKQYNPENADLYEKNKQEYKIKLQELKNEMIEKTRNKQESVISFSESLAYLESTMNLNILTIETDHEHSSLSAEKLKEVIDYAKAQNIKKIMVDEFASTQNAENLANEIDGRVYVLHSGLSGKEKKEAYEEMMRENLKIMEE